MPSKSNITTGDQFGKLTVVAFIGSTGKARLWRCLCGCGEIVERTTSQLHSRQSCGCLRGENNKQHGMRNSPEYAIWRGMKARTRRYGSSGYKNYGGMGVNMCDEWFDSFITFFNYVGPRPSPKHSIDRWPNKFGNYEPGNVRWATLEEQGRNKRTNLMFELNGVCKTCVEWGEILGIAADTLQKRKYSGWSDEKILTTPLRVIKKGKKNV